MSSKRKAADSFSTSSPKRPAAKTITSFFTPKQTASSSSSASAATDSSAKFDKDAWAEKLTSEQRELLQLELDTLHESWFGVLKEELLTPRFLELKRFLKKEKEQGKTIFPPEKDIYSWCVPVPVHIKLS